MSRVEETIKRFQKEMATAEAEDAIASQVPEGARCIHVHSSPLYGVIGSVKYGDEYRADQGIPWARVSEIVRALPAVGSVLVRDGCCSFRPAPHVDSLPELVKERWNEECPVSPIRIDIERNGYFELEWCTRMKTGALVSVSVFVSHIWKLGQYSAKKIERHGGYRYEHARFSPAPNLHTIMRGGTPVAQLESPIHWAQGSETDPGRITLYFCDLGADQDPAETAVAIVDHLRALAEVP